MKILVPDYLLESVLRHYGLLAKSVSADCQCLRAVNAKRVADKEILRIKTLIDRQRKEWKETLEN